MAEMYLAWEILLLEEKARVAARKIEKRMLRDSQNPFELPTLEFRDHFRLPKELVMEIVDSIRPLLQRQRSTGLTAECQVLTALAFYATGSFQRATGANALLSVSQSAVSNVIRDVTLGINRTLLKKWIVFPMTRDERTAAKRLFADKPRPFNGAIGAIDCTHIIITAPKRHEEAYKNHHGQHSVNVQVIVDPRLKVLDVCARWPGARHDAFIWSQSSARMAMKLWYDRGERDTFLLGDSGYPLEPWLLTPLPSYPRGTRQYAFTVDHVRNRNPVERFFGVLKSTERAISGQRVLQYDPSIVGEIFVAICVIHNMRLAAGMVSDIAVEDPLVDLPLPDGNHVPDLPMDANQRLVRNKGEEVVRRVLQGRYGHLQCACQGPPNYHCAGGHP